MAENIKAGGSPVTVDLEGNLSTPGGTPLKGTKKDVVEKGLNVVKNPLSPSTDKTVENLQGGPEMSTVDDVNKEIVDQTKESISSTKKEMEIADEITAENKKQIEEDKVSDIKSAEESKKKKEEILTNADKKVADIETEQQSQLDKEKEQQQAILEREKELAIADAKSQIEITRKENALQNQRDQDAILEAKAGIELERQSSAIAFQKAGLGMSSGIILESQRIATEGLTDVARLKVEAELNADKRDADVQKQIRGTESLSLQYTQNINTLISEYRTNTLNLKRSSVDRINKLTADKFGLEEELADEKETIVREARDAIKEEDEKFITKQKEYKEQLLKDTARLRNEIKAQQEDKKAGLVSLISSGKMSQMSEIERKKLAEGAGMTLDELDFLKDNETQSNIYSETARLMGNDYLLSDNEMTIIKNRVEGYLKSGKSLLEASTLAVKGALGAKAAALKSSSGGKTDKSRYKFVVDANGNQIRIDQDTNVAEPVLTGGAKSPRSGEYGPRFSEEFFNPPTNLKVNTSANNTANKTKEEEDGEIDYLK